MSNLQLAFSVVFPLFFMMAVGYLLRILHIFNDSFLTQLNSLCFKVFLPVLLFVNIYTSDFKSVWNGKLMAYAFFGTLVQFFILLLIVPRFVKDGKSSSVMMQGMFRSNYILFGMSMVSSLYAGQSVSVVAVMIAIIIPTYNVLAVIVLTIFAGGTFNAKKIALDIIKNPLIVAAVVGLSIVGLGIRVPQLVVGALTDISKVATPLALIALGGGFYFSNLKKYLHLLIPTLLGKLVLVPLVFVGCAILLGFRGMELAALFAMFACPAAVSSYTMAQSMGANDELAGQIVVMGSLCSIGTIFVGITLLIQGGFLS